MADFINILQDIRDVKYPDIVTKHTEVEADRAEVATNTATVATDKATTETYKTDAQTAKTLAQNYANANEDVQVELGTYSAKHFSKKAEATSAGVTTAVDTFVNTTVPDITTAYNTNHTTKLAEVQAQVDIATTKASQASTSATSASASATSALASKNAIIGLTTSAITLSSGSSSTASYNSTSGVLTLGIPQGAKGDKGDAFEVNATGLLSQKSLYDTQQQGFSFVSTDTGEIYFKQSATSGDWSTGVPFGKGDTGNGISSITFTSSTGGAGAGVAGETDTYTITYTDTTTDTFTVTNGSVPTKASLGLDLVDNTRDLDKPISTATQTALDLKADQTDLDTTNTNVATNTTAIATKLNATNPSITGSITEEVSAMSSDVLEPDNGTVQTRTLTADTTFTDGLADGQSLTLALNGGDTYVVTYPTTTWVDGAAPTLTASDILVFFKIGTTLYGKYIGTTVQG